MHRQAILDELLFQPDGLRHCGAQILAKIFPPDIRILVDQLDEELSEKLNVIRFVSERIAKHLPNAGELVLPVKRQHHSKQAIKLRAFHALTKQKDVLRQSLLVAGFRKIDVAPQTAAIVYDKVGLFFDRGDVFEHRLAFVRIDTQRADHVDEAVGMDVFLVGMTSKHELEFGRGHDLADDMKDIVADDTFRCREVTNAHYDNPALDIGDSALVTPLFAVFLHLNVLGLPMVRLHRLVESVGPLVLQGQNVEKHRLPAVNYSLRGVGRFCLLPIQFKCAISERDCDAGHVFDSFFSGGLEPLSPCSSFYFLRRFTDSAKAELLSQYKSIYCV